MKSHNTGAKKTQHKYKRHNLSVKLDLCCNFVLLLLLAIGLTLQGHHTFHMSGGGCVFCERRKVIQQSVHYSNSLGT